MTARPKSPVALTALIAFVSLSVVDAAISAWLIRQGPMRESNPLIRLSISHIGLAGTVAAKLVLVAAVAWLVLALRRELAGALPSLLWATNGTYVLIWSIGLFLGLTGSPS